jgi:hypothetical protein
LRGVLSFPNIADHAFTVRVLGTTVLRAGEPYEMRVLTTYSVTGQPVSGVSIAWGTVKTDNGGAAVLKVVLDAEQSLSKHEVNAKLGDFEQVADVPNVSMNARRRDHSDRQTQGADDEAKTRLGLFGLRITHISPGRERPIASNKPHMFSWWSSCAKYFLSLTHAAQSACRVEQLSSSRVPLPLG